MCHIHTVLYAEQQCSKRRQFRIAEAKLPEAWVDREVAECEFKDERLGNRFRSLLEQLSSSPGDSIPLVCQDWATRKPHTDFSITTESARRLF